MPKLQCSRQEQDPPTQGNRDKERLSYLNDASAVVAFSQSSRPRAEQQERRPVTDQLKPD